MITFLYPTELSVGSNVEVMGTSAFLAREVSTVLFESGARLREIGSRAFAGCSGLEEFDVPGSVEVSVLIVLRIAPFWTQLRLKGHPG
jgi:hypothetical protein